MSTDFRTVDNNVENCRRARAGRNPAILSVVIPRKFLPPASAGALMRACPTGRDPSSRSLGPVAPTNGGTCASHGPTAWNCIACSGNKEFHRALAANQKAARRAALTVAAEAISRATTAACGAAGRGPFPWQARSAPSRNSGQPSGNRRAEPTSRGTAPGSCCTACADGASVT